MYSLDDGPVATLRNSRFLVCVVNTQLLESAPGFQVHSKIAAKVFSPSIRVKNLDSDSHTVFHPGFISLVCIRLFVFRLEEIHVSETCLVINVSVHVTLSSLRLY